MILAVWWFDWISTSYNCIAFLFPVFQCQWSCYVHIFCSNIIDTVYCYFRSSSLVKHSVLKSSTVKIIDYYYRSSQIEIICCLYFFLSNTILLIWNKIKIQQGTGLCGAEQSLSKNITNLKATAPSRGKPVRETRRKDPRRGLKFLH